MIDPLYHIPFSPWFFKPRNRPAYPGAYQVYSLGYDHIQRWYSYWNGKRWGLIAPSPRVAKEYRHLRTSYVIDYWRGLAEKPPKEYY